MKVLIVVNAYIKNKSQISQAERIAEELTARGAVVEIKKNFALADIRGNKIAAEKYAFCVFLDKDKVAARLLEKSGLRLFNSAAAIEVCDDKMLTNIALAGGGFNVPDCVYAPLCYHPESDINAAFLTDTAQKLSFPLVAKQNYGSLGAGVALIKNVEELCAYETRNLLTPHFYQKFIDCGAGEDIRVIVIGGKAICSMKRRNDSDFRSNIELGGKGENYPLTRGLAELCERVAKTLSLDYCGVDVLAAKDGKLYICEVNSNAFFAAAERVCGVNVGGAYAEHMLKQHN
ncbi:MAG: RimK family alpha-L-glutamate ligase [Clostridiales bacterium]|nr:RimK family alpha-L-glutamate ligase [Clostridiales bacterium]